MIQLHGVFLNNYVPNWRIARSVTENHIVALVTHGNLIYRIDETDLTLSKGDFLIMRPGSMRRGLDGPYPPHQKYSVHFGLRFPDDHPLFIHFKHSSHILYRTRKFEYFRQRFSTLHQTWNEKSDYYELICQGMMMELYGSIMRELARRDIPAHKRKIAGDVEQYIKAHYKEEIKLARLSELVDLSPGYVTGIFKTVTGQTPIEYVNRLRCSEARDLLIESDMTIAEISDHLGFCDPTYFNRVFKKLTGAPPSALAKRASL